MNNLLFPLAISIAGTHIAIIDIVVLALLLVFLIIGIIKGFSRQIFSLLGPLTALLVAVFTCSKVGTFLTEKIPKLNELAISWANKIPGISTIGSLTPETVSEALSKSEIPALFHGIIIKIVESGKTDIIPVVANWIIIAISFVIIFLLALVAFSIVKKIFSALTKISIIGYVDKLLGVAFGIIKGLVIVFIALVVLQLLAPEFSNSLLTITIDGVQIESVTSRALAVILNIPFVVNIMSSIIGI